MAASRKWVENAVDIIIQYMPGMDGDEINAAREMVQELQQMPGANASVAKTLDAIQQELKKRAI